MSNTLHNIKFPGEGEEYRQARDQLLAEEIALRRKIEEVAVKRRNLPLGGKVKEDYIFEELVTGKGQEKIKETRLSDIFENGKNSLIIYSYMFSEDMKAPCTSCTSILDSMDGASDHVNQRVNLVVVAKSPIKRIKEFADTRGWKHLRFLSSRKNPYNKDYFAEGPDGGQWPACNVFVKTGDGIYHFYSTELLYAPTEENMNPRHVDLIWPLWNYFDLTPEGRGSDWYPKLTYKS